MTRIAKRTFLKGLGAATGAAALGAYVPARAQGEPVRMAFIGPLSGAQQLVGTPMKIGAEVARDQINRAGGIDGRKVELVFHDDKGDPTQSVAAARELVGRGINLILGAPLTATAMAVTGIMPSLNGVYIATGTGDERLTHELFNRHFFTALENTYTRTPFSTRSRPGTVRPTSRRRSPG
jgi:branched-chain amino acid transport system substrate-binding protein